MTFHNALSLCHFKPVKSCFSLIFSLIFSPSFQTVLGDGEWLLPPQVNIAKLLENEISFDVWLQPADLAGRVCCVLDLDETLVHSSFKVWLAPVLILLLVLILCL